MTRKTYDFRCYELAEVFLADDSETVDRNRCQQLAEHIQSAIEDWLEENRSPSILSETVPGPSDAEAK